MKHFLLALLLAGCSSVLAQTTHHLQICEADYPDTISAYDSNALSYLWSNGDTTAYTIVNAPGSLTVNVQLDSSNYTDTYVALFWNTAQAVISESHSGLAYFFDASGSTFIGDSCTTYLWDFDSAATPNTSDSINETVLYPWSNPSSPNEYHVSLTVCNCCGCTTDSFTVSWSVGVKEANESQRLNLFPNPSVSQMTTTVPLSTNARAIAHDGAGRVIEIELKNGSFNVTQLESGLYMLEVESEGQVYFEHFLKL